MKTQLAYCLGTGFYSGLAPRAPGTAGSLLALLLICGLFSILPEASSWQWLILLALVTTGLGVFVTNYLLEKKIFGDSKDPSAIVIDEFAGYFVTIIGHSSSPAILLTGFVLFRFFDIIKPPPIRYIEKLPRGYGIMLDDVFAGLLANASLFTLSYCFPGFIH